jgi:hypothetical protein
MAVAGDRPGFLGACLKNDEDVTPALPAEQPGFALPIPLGNPRSSIWGDPASRIYPENVCGSPGNGPLSPSRRRRPIAA